MSPRTTPEATARPRARARRARSVLLAALALVAPLAGRASAAPPANDNFGNAIVLTGDSVYTNGSNVQATVQAAEPTPDSMSRTVWFRWTAPTGGSVTIDLYDSDFDTVLAVYTGSTLSNLSLVAENDDFDDEESRVDFTAVAGTTYQIQLGGYSGETGDYELLLELYQPPANDAFAAAKVLTGSPATVVDDTTLGSTDEPNEPTPDGSTGSVWYRWTPPSDGVAKLTLDFAEFNPWIAVYTGSSLNALALVGGPGSLNPGEREVRFRADQSTTYRIRVASQFVGDNGFLSFHIQIAAASSNDDFSTAKTLSGTSFATAGILTAATRQAGEPSHRGDTANSSSLWYSWTSPVTAKVFFTTAGSNAASPISVYTGDSIDALTPVVDDYEASSTFGDISFAVVAGTTYRIAVADADGQQSDFLLEGFVAPTNDAFESATVLTGTRAAVEGHDHLSTAQTGEPSHYDAQAANKSVWYTWTAPSDGYCSVDAAWGLAGAPFVAVYTGGAVDALDLVASEDDSFVDFDAVAGTVYRIAVSGSWNYNSDDPRGTNFTLHIVLDEAAQAVNAPNDTFAQATVLSGPQVETTGTNFGATREAGEPAHASAYGATSVWWYWAAPSSGAFIVTTMGSSFDTLLAVYTGDSVSSLERVVAGDDGPGVPYGSSQVLLEAVAGTGYYIAVAGRDGEMGSISLAIQPAGVPITVGLESDRDPAQAGDMVVFTVETPVSGTFTWDFGDGAKTTTSVPRVTHAYETVGDFTASVTITLPGGTTGTSTTELTVLENSVLNVTSLKIKLNFARESSDSVTMTGTVPLRAGATVAGKTVIVNVGGILRSFNLDARGVAKSGNEHLKISRKGAGAQNARFTLKMSKGDFALDLADEGLDDATHKPAIPVVIPVEIDLDGVGHDTIEQLFYKSVGGRSGTAK